MGGGGEMMTWTYVRLVEGVPPKCTKAHKGGGVKN